MTMQELIYLILVFCFGWFMVGILVKKITLEEHIGLSLLMGFGIHSVLYFVFVLYFALLNTSSLIFLAGETVVVVLLSFITRKHSSHININKDQKLRRIIDIVLVALSSLVLLYTFIRCVYWPVYEPDTLYLYDFRAQRLLAGDISIFFKGTSFYQNNLYPPFTSLMHFFLYQVGSVNPKIIYPLILLAFYFVIVGYVKRQTKSNLSGLLVGTLILLTPSVMWNSVIAESNIVFMAYLSLGSLYILDDPESGSGRIGKVLLGSLLLGLSAWIRAEPFWVVPLGVFSIKSLLKKDILMIIVATIIVLSMSRLWLESVARYNVIGVPPPSITKIVEQVKVVVDQSKRYDLAYDLNVALHFLNPLYRSWGLIPPLFIAVVTAEIIIFRKMPNWIEVVAILLSSSVILGLVSFSHRFTQWTGLDDSVYRMATMVVPLYWVSILTSRIWKNIRV